MGIYTIRELARHPEPLAITLYERGEKAGIGMPYSPQTANRTMLANIASIEIPAVAGSYLAWLEALPEQRLRDYGLDPADLNSRQFTPRLLLGEYFRDELMSLLEEACSLGHRVQVCENTEVTDVIPQADGVLLFTADGVAQPKFDRVILATGHVFPDEDAASRTYFPSPWSGLIDADIPAGRIGVLGTSLSGIDAVMAVATQHGQFTRTADGDLRYDLETVGLKIVLMSWTGVLPEADFYCPIPYEPLKRLTENAAARIVQDGSGLDAAFALFRHEITEADPAYADRIRLADLTADSFADAYFADRLAADPFRWAKANLYEVERNKTHQITVAWRYAILRMHEVLGTLVPHLSDEDRDRFDHGLKTVFVDNYAAVPSESIRRLLALSDAGVLQVLALGLDYDLRRDGSQTLIAAAGKTHKFDVFIDARGQRALTSKDLPFPTLRQTLLDAGQDIPEVDENYSLVEPTSFAANVSLGAIPYLMHDRPFVQGITACAEIGAAMARTVRREAIAETRQRRKRWA